jgi:PII-like signaling protein
VCREREERLSLEIAYYERERVEREHMKREYTERVHHFGLTWLTVIREFEGFKHRKSKSSSSRLDKLATRE